MTHNQIDFRNSVENERHNREMERLTGENQAELARHNMASEAETNRANLASEQIRSSANTETARSNLANEEIRTQTNAINYAIGGMNYQLGIGNLSELGRHNAANEKETNRVNTLRVKQDYLNYLESSRHNVETESTNALNAITNVSNAAYNKKRAEASMKDAETRADIAGSEKFKNYTSGITNVTRSAADMSAVKGTGKGKASSTKRKAG